MITDRFNNLSIQKKLAFGFSIAVGIGLSVTATGFYSAYQNAESVRRTALLLELKSAMIQTLTGQENLSNRPLALIDNLRSDFKLTALNAGTRQQYAAVLQQLADALQKMPAPRSDAMFSLIATTNQLTSELLAIELETSQGRVSSTYFQLCLTSLLAMLGSVLSIVLISRSIVPPLKSTVELSSAVANGDLTRQVPRFERRDEMGQLMRANADMTGALRALIGEIAQGIRRLAASSEHILSQSGNARLETEQQGADIAQIILSTDELVQTVNEILRSAEAAAVAAAGAESTAESGTAVINDVVSRINTLSADMSQLGMAMGELHADSTRIGQVIDVIKSIADQTNLLALNAAIEAARAGDHGRGFAVVADEVRALAIRTRTSTEEIESLIVSLQRRASVATDHTSQNLTRTAEVELNTKRAQSSFQEIRETVTRIQAMNQQIAAAAGEQDAAVNQIHQNIEQVGSSATKSAQRAAESALHSQELMALKSSLESAINRFSL